MNPTGVKGEREGRRSPYKAVMGGGKDGDGFLVCWEGDGGMPRWADDTVVAVVVTAAGETQMKGAAVYQAEGGEGEAVTIRKLRNNKRRILGLEWSMSEVGTPPPHNLDKPHGLVASINNNNSII